MQQTEPTYVQSESTQSRSARRLPGLLFAAVALLLLVLLTLLPPLVSVNRFQHRIAASMSQSLGRPVHLDQVSLHLLPLPGFTINNLVVEEDPAFGSEPFIHANIVQATLRISSLWRGRVEFSTISFTDQTSVNLVHLPSGKWNLQSILLHAAHIEAAPTAQKNAGPAPRFPYIEATGARLNLKLGQEKIPLSLTDAAFALWLPDPQQWRLRLQARPARTDTNVSDTGTLQLEGTLGRAALLGDVPVSLQGEWRNAPLGESTRLLFGRDAGLRGQMTLSANVQGTVSRSAAQARLRLTDARRADFVPDQPLSVDIECLGNATSDFHAVEDLRCTWPPTGSSSTPMLAITGDLPDIRRIRSTTLDVGTPGLSAATLLDWLRVASSRVPAGVTATGTLTGSLSWRPGAAPLTHWSGEMLLADAGIINPKAGRSSLVTGNISLQSISTAAPPPPPRGRYRSTPPPPASNGFQLAPVALALGGKDPAMLDGHFDSTGYTLHLTGMASTARLLALGSAIPQFGDGLAAALPVNRASGPFRIDLTATRPWRGEQVWTDNATHPTPVRPRRTRQE